MPIFSHLWAARVNKFHPSKYFSSVFLLLSEVKPACFYLNFPKIINSIVRRGTDMSLFSLNVKGHKKAAAEKLLDQQLYI